MFKIDIRDNPRKLNRCVFDKLTGTQQAVLFAGESDTRVPKEQSVEMFRALKSLNVPTQLLIGPSEGHLWGSLPHLLRKANLELEWFERYANGRAYVWEKAPSS